MARPDTNFVLFTPSKTFMPHSQKPPAAIVTPVGKRKNFVSEVLKKAGFDSGFWF
jgi:hypothetical protein